jgi:excisionase family DNA binding protein
MSKKYLSLEEAADALAISTSELNRLREKGEIRAFADRGTWKFKEEDVERLGRTRQADSAPDLPLHGDVPPVSRQSQSDLVLSGEDALSDQPTIIRKSAPGENTSDSDVQLIFDDSMRVGDADVSPDDETQTIPLADDSDSDVQLGMEPHSGDTSDSDVKLVSQFSDSDVKLSGSDTSDSDVQLASASGIRKKDSDVKLPPSKRKEKTGSDSDVAIVPAPRSTPRVDGGSSLTLPPIDDDEEGISLAPLDDDDLPEPVAPAPNLQDSSSSVFDDDSGISISGSNLMLASESGISLESPNDSGISLSHDSTLNLVGDSGITLEPSGGDSGISLMPDSDVDLGGPGKQGGGIHGTVPMMNRPSGVDEDEFDTRPEVPLMSDDDDASDYAIATGDDSDAHVITLDDEDDVDESSSTFVRKRDDDEDDGDLIVEEFVDDEFGVADDIMGEDDALGEDAFGVSDEDFGEDSLETGESHAELPVAYAGRGLAAPVEQDWGTGTFVGLALSAVIMVLCSTMTFDLVRNLWHTDIGQHNPVASFLLETVSGLF